MSSDGKVPRSQTPRNLPSGQGKITSIHHRRQGWPGAAAHERGRQVAGARDSATKSPRMSVVEELKEPLMRLSAFGYGRVTGQVSQQAPQHMRKALPPYAQHECYTLHP